MGEKYTWEDFEELTKVFFTCNICEMPGAYREKRKAVVAYFIEHPEELMEYGVFHEKGYDRETVIGILKGEITSTISF